jgi:pSer/pThr/pTyr-binding forkhead associated (FHA) protein
MRLCFPNGEFPERGLDRDGLTLGSGTADAIPVSGDGVLAQHARLVYRNGGFWLELAPGAPPAYVNARPVRSRALLRAGDALCVEQLQMVLRESASIEGITRIPATTPTSVERAEASPRVVLRGVAGPNFGRSFVVVDALLIGRAASVGLRLDGSEVAERHAQIECHGDRVALRAISGSQLDVNGTLGGDRFLAPGDQIAIGQHRFVLEAPGLALASPAEADSAETAGSTVSPRRFEANAGEGSSGRGVAIWWLIASAAVLAAIITGLLLYGPRDAI